LEGRAQLGALLDAGVAVSLEALNAAAEQAGQAGGVGERRQLVGDPLHGGAQIRGLAGAGVPLDDLHAACQLLREALLGRPQLRNLAAAELPLRLQAPHQARQLLRLLPQLRGERPQLALPLLEAALQLLLQLLVHGEQLLVLLLVHLERAEGRVVLLLHRRDVPLHARQRGEELALAVRLIVGVQLAELAQRVDVAPHLLRLLLDLQPRSFSLGKQSLELVRYRRDLLKCRVDLLLDELLQLVQLLRVLLLH